jgi:uncharacterized membrane protein
MQEKPKRDKGFSVERIGEYLHKVSPLLDESGKVVQYVTSPLMVELHNRDVLQIIVGATLFAIPVGFTQEVWDLGQQLSMGRILTLAAFSIISIAIFVYLNFYRNLLRRYWGQYVKRVVVIYGIAFLMVTAMLTIIDKAPWGVDNVLAIKRILLVTFPASMSGALSDLLK